MSKVTLNRKELLSVMKPMAVLINHYTVLPILEGALFEFKDKLLKVSVTNLNEYFTATITVITEKEFGFVVDYKLFVAALKNAESETIFIRLDNDTLTISNDDFNVKLPDMNATEFPKATEMKDIKYFIKDVEAAPFLTTLKTALPFASTDDLRPAMTGVNLSDYKGMLTIVSTDAHRLYWKGLKPIVDLKGINITLEKSGVKAMIGAFKSNTIEIEISDNHFAVWNDTFRIVSRLIDAKYPNYDAVIPTNPETFITKRKQLKAALTFALPYLNRATKSTKIEVTEMNMVVSGGEIDFGTEFTHKVPVYQNSLEKETYKVGMNANFLIEALSISKDELVKFNYTTSSTKALIIDDCLLLMPMLYND